MSRKPIYVPAVKKCLQECSLTYGELRSRLIEDSSINRVDDKTLNGALMKLLKNRKITISGYKFGDYNVSRMQSIPNEGLIFEWITNEWKDEWKIYQLLNQLENKPSQKDNEKNEEDPKYELNRIFRRKYEEYVDEQKKFYEMIKSKTHSVPYKEEMSKPDLKDLINKLEEKIKNREQAWTKSEVKLRFDPRESRLKNELEQYQEIYEKYDDTTIWKLDITSDEARKITGIKKRGTPPKDTTRGTAELLALSRGRVIDTENLSKEEVLEFKGVFSPEELNVEQQIVLFNQILFYVNTCEKFRFMKQRLSRALSDEKDSLDWFELFVDNNIYQTKKLRKEFGINEKENTLQDKLMESQQIIDEHLNQTKKQSDEEQLIALIKKVAKKP